MNSVKNVFQTLADSNRLKIINAIAENEMAVGELVKSHLAVAAAGFVSPQGLKAKWFYEHQAQGSLCLLLTGRCANAACH
jgi:DNA-binding transcriptional ArsR family regulator